MPLTKLMHSFSRVWKIISTIKQLKDIKHFYRSTYRDKNTYWIFNIAHAVTHSNQALMMSIPYLYYSLKFNPAKSIDSAKKIHNVSFKTKPSMIIWSSDWGYFFFIRHAIRILFTFTPVTHLFICYSSFVQSSNKLIKHLLAKSKVSSWINHLKDWWGINVQSLMSE